MEYEKFLIDNISKRKIRCKTTQKVLRAFQRLARSKLMNASEYACLLIEDEMRKNPTKEIEGMTDTDLIKDTSLVLKAPEAVVYTVPISGTKIVVAPNDELLWIGLCVNPDNPKELSGWHAENLRNPGWTKTSTVSRMMFALSTRVDLDNGIACFNVRHEKVDVQVSAKWHRGEFINGEIKSTDNKKIQKWYKQETVVTFEGEAERDMTKRHFNHLTFLRRFLTMLCRAHFMKDGGLDRKVATGSI